MIIIDACRVCDNPKLLPIIDLGEQALTNVFPRSAEDVVPSFPVEMVRCSPDGCGLVQLRHSPEPTLMYNENYPYNSSVRPFMVSHLGGKVAKITKLVDLGPGDAVLDIGSNDSTTLRSYPPGPQLVGIDPSAEQFRTRYPEGAELVVDFFSRQAWESRMGTRKAKAVTSIAMFYDLPRPLQFVQDIADILDDGGVWLMEQSYMPAMLDTTGYDILCHEHLEFYALRDIEWMAERAGLTVIAAELTEVYGGSLEVILAKNPTRHRIDEAGIARIRAAEAAAGIDTMTPFDAFATRTVKFREELVGFLADSKAAGKLTIGYGASTKGNVILQYCGFGPAELPVIGEPAPGKWGRFTPGTGIPIVSEEDAKALKPDQMLVLPWIYRDQYIEREREYLRAGGALVFPHPTLDVVTWDDVK